MPEAEGENDIEVTCPICGHTWTETFHVIIEFEMSDYAPDYN